MHLRRGNMSVDKIILTYDIAIIISEAEAQALIGVGDISCDAYCLVDNILLAETRHDVTCYDAQPLFAFEINHTCSGCFDWPEMVLLNLEATSILKMTMTPPAMPSIAGSNNTRCVACSF